MIASFGDLDVRRVLWRSQHARRVLIVEIVRQVGNGAVPSVFREASGDLAGIALRARIQDDERARGARLPLDPCGGENALQLSSAEYGVHFRNILLYFVAVALDQTARNNQLLGATRGLVLGHLEDGVHRFLLGGVDERAGVNDNDVGVFGAGRNLCATLRQQPHHDLAIHQVLGAAEAHKPDFWSCISDFRWVE